MDVELGCRVRDATTGYEGVAVARTERWHGPTQVAVERTDVNGVPQEHWFYETRLEQVAVEKPAPGF